jgi:hypothetical protein
MQAGMKTIYKTENPFWVPLTGIIGIALGLVELLSYIYLFYYLFKHNQTLHILPEEARKSRNKFNAVTMMGQFYFYMTDQVYILFLIVTFVSRNTFPPDTKDLIAVLKTAEFGIFSVVQCFLIPEIRIKMQHKMQKLRLLLKPKFM